MNRYRRRLLGAIISAALVLVAIGTAIGQSGWDPDLYVELSQSGQAKFLEALNEEAGSEVRRDLLFAASGELKEALYMVRQAIKTGDVEAVRGEARRDFFTLMENLTVVWLALDACAPAQELVDVAVSHSDVEPEDLALFENLSPRLSACRERANVWVWARYQGLVARADMRREQATAGARTDHALLGQASLASAEALRTYRAALFDGELGAIPFEDAVGELFIRYDATVGLQLEVSDCGGARESANALEADLDRLLGVWEPDLINLAAVDTCVEPQPGDVPAEEDPVASAARLREAASWALVGSGVLLGAAAVAVIATTNDGNNQGNTGVTAGVVGGLGVALISAGVVLLLTDEDPAEADAEAVSVTPMFGPGSVGALLGGRF